MKVTIYTTPICPYCVATKEYFKQNNVKYSEKDVSVDEKARDLMIEKSGQVGVPVIVVSNSREDVIIGFNKPVLDKVLGIGGYAVTKVDEKTKKSKK